jgi:hypothetical protein
LWWAKSTMGIKSFRLRSSRIRKTRKIGLNQLLVRINTFPPLSPHFYVPFFKSVVCGQKNSSQVWKILEGHLTLTKLRSCLRGA